jgi:epoxide hydrolase-like predicted phosphatase
MIKAAIFDFGRVISAQKPPSLFRLYEEELGLEPDTINTIMFDSQAWQDALTGQKTEAQFWDAIGPKLGLNSRDATDTFRRRYRRDEAINPGVIELIHRLRTHLKTAILSNSPPGLVQWLDDWGIRELFDTVFCSGDEGLAKPDPAAFEAVLQRLDVAPEEALFVDDTNEHVLAARTLGLRAIPFTTTEELAEELRDFLAPLRFGHTSI